MILGLKLPREEFDESTIGASWWAFLFGLCGIVYEFEFSFTTRINNGANKISVATGTGTRFKAFWLLW